MNFRKWHDYYTVHTLKSQLKDLYISLGVFFLLFVLLHLSSTLYISSLVTQSSSAFVSGLEKEKNHLKIQGDLIVQDNFLIQKLLDNDSAEILNIIKKEKVDKNIGLIGVANSEGVIVSRTFERAVPGQNVFLTVPAGRRVAGGESVQSVEMTGFGNQLFITTARPIIHNEQMIGALFANYLTDDRYAKHFRSKYLPGGQEVVFYTKEYGVYGNSFSNTETRSLVNSYFNSGSEWVKDGVSDKTIFFKNGGFYYIKNIVFPGLDQSPGGAIIFIPRLNIFNQLNVVAALIAFSVFIFFAVRRFYVRHHSKEITFVYYALTFIVSLPLLIIALALLFIQNVGYSNLEHVPYTLYNSTLRLQPEFGIYDVNFEQRFLIMMDTGDESVNSVSVGLKFDPKLIEVRMLDTASSSCVYLIENSVNNILGEASLACTLSKSEGERHSLVIAEVVVNPRSVGTFTLSFDKEKTKVLASDGLGTDVLRLAQSGSYKADIFNPSLFGSLSSTTASTTLGRSFVVFSTTHPNQSRWYNSKTATFVWKGNPKAIYRYEFDTYPDTVPTNKNIVKDSAVTIPVSGDGVFYFHLQLTTGGPVAHYRIQADRTPPVITGLRLSSDTIAVGGVVRLLFESEDVSSGVQKNYYVDLGDHLFLPVGSQLFIPFLKAGDQNVILRVYDDAGNYSEKTEVVHVESN